MDFIDVMTTLLTAGYEAEKDYLAYHVLLCLVPAFFIAGAIKALTTPDWVLRHLGAKSPKYVSYPLAAFSGLLISVCSCTIIPLFAGIWKKGAGLGPAVAFLYSGPAVNLLALTYTGSLIGWDIALYRALFSIIFAIAIGLIMDLSFPETRDIADGSIAVNASDADGSSPYAMVVIGLLLVMLIGGTTAYSRIFGVSSESDFLMKNVAVAIAAVALTTYTIFLMPRDVAKEWLSATREFALQIAPLLLAGVFLAGIAKELIPEGLISDWAGKNSLLGVIVGVLFGVFMYFPTLVEVPIAKLFLDEGMAKGPLLAYLLADPVLSVQSILVTGRIMGGKRIALFVVLTSVFSVIAGLAIGLLLNEGISWY